MKFKCRFFELSIGRRSGKPEGIPANVVRDVKWEKGGLSFYEDTVQLTPEQIDAQRNHVKALEMERLTQPSSKEGRDIYFSRLSWLETPGMLWMFFKEWLNGDEVWYSKTGLRHTTHYVNKKV